jgi:fatty-acyl-CoA synthase
MTETSPVASVCRPGPDAPEDRDARFRLRATQGRVVPLVDFTIDEKSGGELLVRGPWVAKAYYEDDSQKERFEGGWLRTGDVAEVVDGSFIKLVDRTKDLVKSGGEWISSVELENAVMAHPKVMEAAVVAVADEKWGERPCACVVACEGEELDADELRSFLAERVAKWWVPDRIEFIDEVPKTAVGKFDKKVLRKRLAEEAGAMAEEAGETAAS